MSKPCGRCGNIKSWSGDDPVCPFRSSDSFGENWNCGLINRLRDLVGDEYVYCDDQYYRTFNISEAEGDDGEIIGLALWMTWYKRRGATDAIYILDHHDPPRVPTFRELEILVDYIEANKKYT